MKKKPMENETESVEPTIEPAPAPAPAPEPEPEPEPAPETEPAPEPVTDSVSDETDEEERHACPDCDATFTKANNLSRHRKQRHDYAGPRSKPKATPKEEPSQPTLQPVRKAQSPANAEKGRNAKALSRKIPTADVLDAFVLKPFLPPELAQWERDLLQSGGVDEVEIPQVAFLALVTLAIVVPRAQAAWARMKEAKAKSQLDAQQHEARKAAIEEQAKANAAAEEASLADAKRSAMAQHVETVQTVDATLSKTPNIVPNFEA